ncbi:Component of a membrane-bound complex containing the Tor2p kinase [Tilletia horrida]|uniref:Component of a membrane-bound complex containing the Tor2p kinase n=1 Tax=Tilletia horrida TaxID=155126 RepID=A0AAN6JTA0_9BASI|nr:Component of a membrane-bound complex containing the Tor2p kinase [Tilletia horrida]KAK0569400.1 Component of a membrane-bound complex containing the Tor2p kinase [Tilletia horrida]
MSVLTDADWVTRSLRVGYLRYVDDHYARQVIEDPLDTSHGLDIKTDSLTEGRPGTASPGVATQRHEAANITVNITEAADARPQIETGAQQIPDAASTQASPTPLPPPQPPPPLTFTKLSVSEIRDRSLAQRPQVSAIAASLQAQSDAASNPFAALYRDVCGRSATATASAVTTPQPSATSQTPALGRLRHGPSSHMMSGRSLGPAMGRGRGPGGLNGASSRSPGGPLQAEVYFPFADKKANSGLAPPSSQSRSGPVASNPKAGSMTLTIRPDAKMEEVIGYGLYCYVDAKWKPSLSELSDWATGDQNEIKLTTLGWCLRMVEDGEVDDDFPPIDRALVAGKFGGEEFAIVQASAAQVKDNEVSSAPFRAARTAALTASLKAVAKAQMPTTIFSTSLLNPNLAAAPTAASTALSVPASGLAGSQIPGSSAQAGNLGISASIGTASTATIVPSAAQASVGALAAPIGGASLSQSAAQGRSMATGGGLAGANHLEASVFLRILHTAQEDVQMKILIQVLAQWYFADVLDQVCRKVGKEDPKEWALVAHYGEEDVVVPLNRTVESLDEACDLKLVRRETLVEKGTIGSLTAPGGNPNTSIFAGRNKKNKQKSENTLDMSAYKTWKVIRAARSARMFSKPEQLFTLDGEWIWIEPFDTRHYSARPTSFHISSVIACSTKGGAFFKLVVRRMPSLVDTNQRSATTGAGKDTKRYDLEAESAEDAEQIVQEILKTMRRRDSAATETAG